MSRIGKKIIEIPEKVEVKIEPEKVVVTGPKGTLTKEYDPRLKIIREDKVVKIERTSSDPRLRALHGLYNKLFRNMIEGVSKGWEKTLELVGVGYRAAKEGNKLMLQLGYSNPVEINPGEGIDFVLDGPTKIKVVGIDKDLVGRVAAQIRSLREIEPYKGKGLKYLGEKVRRKAGKVVKAAAGGAAGG